MPAAFPQAIAPLLRREGGRDPHDHVTMELPLDDDPVLAEGDIVVAMARVVVQLDPEDEAVWLVLLWAAEAMWEQRGG